MHLPTVPHPPLCCKPVGSPKRNPPSDSDAGYIRTQGMGCCTHWADTVAGRSHGLEVGMGGEAQLSSGDTETQKETMCGQGGTPSNREA